MDSTLIDISTNKTIKIQKGLRSAKAKVNYYNDELQQRWIELESVGVWIYKVAANIFENQVI